MSIRPSGVAADHRAHGLGRQLSRVGQRRLLAGNPVPAGPGAAVGSFRRLSAGTCLSRRKTGFRASRMGFQAVAKHRHKNVLLYRQGTINFILNAEPDSFAQKFAREHGPSVCAIAFRVQDAKQAYERATALGAWGFADKAGPGELNIPAIKGIGDSIIYFIDRWRGKNGAREGDIGNIGFFDVDFEPLPGAELNPVGHGLTYIDHLTHNVHRGRMEEWAGFYERLFNFREV
eukprot:gene43949-58591_t